MRSGSSLVAFPPSSLVDDPFLQLAAVATGLMALIGGTGLQVVALLVLVAVVASRLVGSPADSEGPGRGGNGGDGGLDRPLDTTPVPPAGSGVR